MKFEECPMLQVQFTRFWVCGQKTDSESHFIVEAQALDRLLIVLKQLEEEGLARCLAWEFSEQGEESGQFPQD